MRKAAWLPGALNIVASTLQGEVHEKESGELEIEVGCWIRRSTAAISANRDSMNDINSCLERIHVDR